jgi:hypothetical protein
MKKLFLFTCLSALALTFNSCSDDDSSSTGGNGGTFTATINGVQKTYNTVTVAEDEYSDGETYLIVTGSQDGSADENIYFELAKDETGTNAIYYAEITTGGDTHYASEINTNVTVNNGSQVKGTFSGTVHEWSNEQQEDVLVLTVTGGSFEANY